MMWLKSAHHGLYFETKLALISQWFSNGSQIKPVMPLATRRVTFHSFIHLTLSLWVIDAFQTGPKCKSHPVFELQGHMC